MEIQILIGNKIRHHRNKKKLTQEAVAYKAELDRTYMNHVENGKRNISIGTLQKILTALDTSFQEFFSDEEFKKK